MERSLLLPESNGPSQYTSLSETSGYLNSIFQCGYTDVILISSDKVRIPAVRSQLSTNSTYFDTLLNSEFAGRDHFHISVSIHSNLLLQVLDFINDSSCYRLRHISAKTRTSNGVTCKDVKYLVELGFAADYLCVEGLLLRCKILLQHVMRVQSYLACLFVRALGNGRFSWGRELIQEAVKTILANPEETLFSEHRGCNLKCGILHLDAAGAEVLFESVKSKKLEQDKFFQALIVWSSGGTALLKKWKRPSWADCKIMIDIDSIQILENRRETAKGIAKLFDLASFSPAYLSNIVNKSELVGEHALYLAHKKQAEQ